MNSGRTKSRRPRAPLEVPSPKWYKIPPGDTLLFLSGDRARPWVWLLRAGSASYVWDGEGSYKIVE
eukprot:5196823-Prymnesium_polylepis.1